jgi:hypothetical protein
MIWIMLKLTELTGYLAPTGFVAELKRELGSCVREVYGDLVVAAGQRLRVAWVANIWYEPVPDRLHQRCGKKVACYPAELGGLSICVSFQPSSRANRQREEPMNKAKPFGIPKREVWEAFKHVKANQGAAGIDGQSVAEFEADLTLSGM